MYQTAETWMKIKKQHIPSHRSFGLSRLSVSLAAHIFLRQITAEFKHSSRDVYALTSMFKHVQQWIYSETPAARKMTQQIKLRDFHSVQYNKREQDISLHAVPFSSVKLGKKRVFLNI